MKLQPLMNTWTLQDFSEEDQSWKINKQKINSVIPSGTALALKTNFSFFFCTLKWHADILLLVFIYFLCGKKYNKYLLHTPAGI